MAPAFAIFIIAFLTHHVTAAVNRAENPNKATHNVGIVLGSTVAFAWYLVL